MKRIIVDLDVVTVYLWDESPQAETAKKFIEKLQNADFEVLVPYMLLELVTKWKHTELSRKILEFYKGIGTEIKIEQVKHRLEVSGINDKSFALSLVSIGVKEEDAALVMLGALFDAYCIVTFNKKHLKNKEAEINHALASFNLPKLRIYLPQNFFAEAENDE